MINENENDFLRSFILIFIRRFNKNHTLHEGYEKLKKEKRKINKLAKKKRRERKIFGIM